jgi:hypothetical protein
MNPTLLRPSRGSGAAPHQPAANHHQHSALVAYDPASSSALSLVQRAHDVTVQSDAWLKEYLTTHPNVYVLAVLAIVALLGLTVYRLWTIHWLKRSPMR